MIASERTLATRSLVLITRDEQTRASVAAAARSLTEGTLSVRNGRDLDELERLLAQEEVAIALVDVDPDPMSVLRRLEPMLARSPHTRVVVLCDELESELVLEAMQVGARHCMVKESVPSELASVIRRLGSFGDAPEGGEMVTVLSARGGCGATTTAVNLAAELNERSGEKTLLVDLDVHYGTISSYLGLKSHYGLADVLAHEGAIDAQLVQSTATAWTDGLRVLASPASVRFDDPAPLALEHLDQALTACRAAFPHTVVDAPRASARTAASLVAQSSVSLIVFELSVIDIRAMRALLGALRDQGISDDSLICVANRWRKRGNPIALDNARDALGRVRIETVTNDFENATRSTNLGRPLSQVAARSALRKDIQALAAAVETARSAR